MCNIFYFSLYLIVALYSIIFVPHHCSFVLSYYALVYMPSHVPSTLPVPTRALHALLPVSFLFTLWIFPMVKILKPCLHFFFLPIVMIGKT